MASSSGSEGGEVQEIMNERKRKRMQSNRESARRSRARKQQHLDDLTAQVAQIKRENHQILQTISLTTQQFLTVDAENSVLRAQMGELSQRLDSLNEILNYMNALGGGGGGGGEVVMDGFGFGGVGMGDLGIFDGYNGHNNFNNDNNPWGMGYLNQPIMAASGDLLQY